MISQCTDVLRHNGCAVSFETPSDSFFSALKHIKLTNCDTKTRKTFLQQLSAQLFLELPQNRQKMEVCQLELFGLVSFFFLAT